MHRPTRAMTTALSACVAARAIHLKYLDSHEVIVKKDGSPVTVADREAEAAMRAIILDVFENDGIIGEEGGETRGSSGRDWIVDPLDGTIQYVRGMSDFGTLLCRVDDQGIELGVVMHTASDTFWMAERGRGTWKAVGLSERIPKGPPTAVRVDARPVPDRFQDAVTCFGHPNRLADAGICINRLMKSFPTQLTVPRFQAFTLVAEGKLDIFVARLVNDWDLLANQIIVEQARGTVISFDLANGRHVVAARSRELAEETVAEIMRSIG
ncbi:MAG: inositol monophosphatase family protein [Candidatus Uhrbacteria bacterium]